VPGEDDGSLADKGALNVLYGSASGLTATGNQFFRGAHTGDQFGSALAAGNFNAAAGVDLAVGAPNASNGGKSRAGEVVWMLGTSSGLQGFHPTLDANPEVGSHCGASLASLNWDNVAAGNADVVAGCPNALVDGVQDAGEVDLHIGSPSGLSDGVVDFLSPNVQAFAEFGTAVAGADFGRDGGGGRDDIVVGEPLYDVGGLVNAGRVDVLYLVHSQAVVQVIRQGLNGTVGKTEAGDEFGAAVTTSDFDRPGWADVAVGVPNEGVGSVIGAGGVTVVYGSPTGLDPTVSQFWSQNSAGIVGVAEPSDFFGSAVSGRNE
jgi:hypothetical protein